MIKKILRKILGTKQKKRYMICSDEYTNTHASLLDMISKLEARIEFLEKENIGSNNYLYELDNRIDDLKREVKMSQYDMTLREFGLDK